MDDNPRAGYVYKLELTEHEARYLADAQKHREDEDTLAIRKMFAEILVLDMQREGLLDACRVCELVGFDCGHAR